MYYLYRHIRTDKGIPFYIGIGKKLRAERILGLKTEYSRAFSKVKRSTFWKNITNKTNYEVEILFETNDINIIIEKEKEFINLYGRINNNSGILVNLTSGGHGIESFSHSEDSKKRIGNSSKIRKRKKGYKLNMSEEGRLNLSLKMKTRVVSEETRRKMSENMKGNKRGLKIKICNNLSYVADYPPAENQHLVETGCLKTLKPE